MENSVARGVAFLVLVSALQACGNGGGSDPVKPGNPTSPTPTSGSTGTTSGGDPSEPGPVDSTDSGTNAGSGTPSTGGTDGSVDTTSPPAPPPIELPGRLTINLPFNCPADENSIVGCWVSEVCELNAASNTSYRNVLWFNNNVLLNIFIHWGVPGCPADQTPSMTQDTGTPNYVYGEEVLTTTEGITGHKLDVDQGTKTVVGEILQLRQYGVQRMCFHETHYLPTSGIDPAAQRAVDGPYVIDNTQCLQRHLD